VGYDINCGVRLLASQLSAEEIHPYLDDVASALYANCPSGVGKGGQVKLKPGELDDVMERGARWAVKRGFGTEEDLERTEENGCCPERMPRRSAPAPRTRPGPVGTLGPATTSLKWMWLIGWWTSRSAGTSVFLRGRSWFRSTAARAGSGTRSARTTSTSSRGPSANTPSSCPTASWSAPH